MLFSGGFGFESVEEILKCDHSKEFKVILSCGSVYYAVQGGPSFCLLGMKSESVTIQIKGTEQNFPVVLFIVLYNVVYLFSLWSKS